MRFNHVVDAAKAQLSRVMNERPELSAYVADQLDITATFRSPPNLTAVAEVLKRIEVLHFQKRISGAARHYAHELEHIKAMYTGEMSRALAHKLMPHIGMIEERMPQEDPRLSYGGDTLLRGQHWFIQHAEPTK